ncbi:MAG TPA: 4-hydroxy-tetrahydrodipicolinate reductase [Blastocatellia bacterium]|nr:4-hydroxy-tetrahydrodipicolinate reductase [Blastocatellia bacterium]
MKLALFGYGKMGRLVEQAAARHGFEVVAVVDPEGGSRGAPGDADVWIDFSEPESAIENMKMAAAARMPIVVGTTGWYNRIDEAKRLVADSGIGLVYGSNFSLGVNLTFKIVQRAAELFGRFAEYDPFIEEAHHKFKKDAPSGTAIFLERILKEKYTRTVPVSSTRAGYIPGSHTVGFDSEADTVTISHVARGRSGFAQGAVAAAEWIRGRNGFYEFSEIIDEMLAGDRRLPS